MTSGGVPASYHGLNRVAVYTQEIAEDVRRRSPTTVPHVLPARLDFRMLSSDVRKRSRAIVRPPLGISETDLLIVRVARCADVAAADVCIASGRSALEAVALERPTIVAWGERYLGMVDAGNIARVAETNFQGRQSERVSSDEDVLARMREAIDARATDEVTAQQTQSACAAFVREHYSVERAADVYE